VASPHSHVQTIRVPPHLLVRRVERLPATVDDEDNEQRRSCARPRSPDGSGADGGGVGVYYATYAEVYAHLVRHLGLVPLGLMRHGAKTRPAQIRAMAAAVAEAMGGPAVAGVADSTGPAATPGPGGTGLGLHPPDAAAGNHRRVPALPGRTAADTLPAGEDAAADSLAAYYQVRLPSERDRGFGSRSAATLPPLLPLPYVYTAPDADAKVKADDLIFVLVSVHNTAVAAAHIVQRQWRHRVQLAPHVSAAGPSAAGHAVPAE
jgi:hypothetical protein